MGFFRGSSGSTGLSRSLCAGVLSGPDVPVVQVGHCSGSKEADQASTEGSRWERPLLGGMGVRRGVELGKEIIKTVLMEDSLLFWSGEKAAAGKR